MAVALKDLLLEAVEKYGTQSAAAKAIGIDRTRISKVLCGDADPDDSLETANCLRLARALGRSPCDVLSAIGKRDEAELITELFGPERQPVPARPQVITSMRVNEIERAVIEAMRVAKVAGASSVSSEQVPHDQDDVPAHESGE